MTDGAIHSPCYQDKGKRKANGAQVVEILELTTVMAQMQNGATKGEMRVVENSQNDGSQNTSNTTTTAVSQATSPRVPQRMKAEYWRRVCTP